MRVSADRRTVVVASAPGAVIVDGLSGQPHPLLQMANALSISPDGQNLVAGSDTGDITVWDVGSGTRRGVGRRHTGLVRDAVWSPDERTFASTSDDRLTVIWDAASLRPLAVFAGAAGPQLHVRYSPDGQAVYTAGLDGGLYLWDVTGRRGLETELDPPGFYSAAQPLDNPGPVAFDFPRKRAVVFESGVAHIVDLTTGRPTGPPLELGWERYRWPTVSADGRRLAVGFSNGHGRVWDLESRRLLLDVGELSMFSGISEYAPYDQADLNTVLSLDGRTVALAGYRLDAAGPGGEPKRWSSVVRFYDVDTRVQLGDPWIIEDATHNRLGISPDGRYVAISLDHGRVGVWDLANRREAAMLRGAPGRQHTSVRFSPDGQYLAADSIDGRPTLWRLGTWLPVWQADVGHNGVGVLLSFSPDGRILASSGSDSKIFLYDVSTGALVGRAIEPDNSSWLYAEFRPDRNELVGYFSNGALHRWDLDPASWTRHACEIAGRDMTQEEWQRALPGRPYQHVCPQS